MSDHTTVVLVGGYESILATVSGGERVITDLDLHGSARMTATTTGLRVRHI